MRADRRSFAPTLGGQFLSEDRRHLSAQIIQLIIFWCLEKALLADSVALGASCLTKPPRQTRQVHSVGANAKHRLRFGFYHIHGSTSRYLKPISSITSAICRPSKSVTHSAENTEFQDQLSHRVLIPQVGYTTSEISGSSIRVAGALRVEGFCAPNDMLKPAI